MSAARQPCVAITLGDPAGIGPEVLLKALSDPDVFAFADWIVVGSFDQLRKHADALRISQTLVNQLSVIDPTEGSSQIEWGRVSASAGKMALSFVKRAAELCLYGSADAMVTAPVNKEAVSLSAKDFVGHTEYIAGLCGISSVRMLLANPRLSVVHVTTHRSLRRACDLEIAPILKTIELGHEAMLLLGFSSPRIMLCGLNPHAGENGLFGAEDDQFIRPAVEAAAAKGINCTGPYPADTLFLKAIRGGCDLIVAMYHDQGHIPMKLIDFENTVNVTLGLPIIRTSVDHGTGFDIVGQNIADPTSMKAALKLAVRFALGRKSGQVPRAVA